MNPYYLPTDYRERLEPEYFFDDPHSTYQWSAYTLAADLASQPGVSRVVDLGAGGGHKLKACFREGPDEVVAVDYGANLRLLDKQGFLTRHVDFEYQTYPFPGEFKDAVVICADVIEHLKDPSCLLTTLVSALMAKPRAIVLSTPDRGRVYDGPYLGPPRNPAHVREWTLLELQSYLLTRGLGPWSFVGHMAAYPGDPKRRTSLLVMHFKGDKLLLLDPRLSTAHGLERRV